MGGDRGGEHNGRMDSKIRVLGIDSDRLIPGSPPEPKVTGKSCRNCPTGRKHGRQALTTEGWLPQTGLRHAYLPSVVIRVYSASSKVSSHASEFSLPKLYATNKDF